MLGIAAGALLATAAAAPAATPSVTLAPGGVQRFEGRDVLLAGEVLALRAQVRAAPPGSRVEFSYRLNGQPVREASHPSTTAAVVQDVFPASEPGVLLAEARLVGSDDVVLGRSQTIAVTAIQPVAGLGARGIRVRYLQGRLAALRYAIRLTGRYDDATRRAVIAFRKVNRLARVGNASPRVFRLAGHGRGAYRVRFPRRGRHVEADLTRQVLALVDRGGRLFRVYHTSSGGPGFRTPTGNHRFYANEPGLNSRQMYYTTYFTHQSGGRPACGIHGYFAVPTTARSHCCLRVPNADAPFIYRWVHLGDRLSVFY